MSLCPFAPFAAFLEQRNKELSHTLRLCHLHATNGDGTQAATFGFELSEDADYEYPIILRVESQSPAEGAGLQSRDILLKINDRKTKGLGYEKVKKEIEKAKRDGRLEMLVVDQETFDYCKRTKKPMKEPDIKVKHIFPKSRSSASFHKLPIAATAGGAGSSSFSSRGSVEQLSSSGNRPDESVGFYHPSSSSSSGQRLPTAKETDSDDEEGRLTLSGQRASPIIKSPDRSTRHAPPPTVNFDLSTGHSSHADASTHPHESPLKFLDRAQAPAQQIGVSNIPHSPSATQTNQNRTPTKEPKGSKSKALPNAINSLFHKIGHSKSSKRS